MPLWDPNEAGDVGWGIATYTPTGTKMLIIETESELASAGFFTYDFDKVEMKYATDLNNPAETVFVVFVDGNIRHPILYTEPTEETHKLCQLAKKDDWMLVLQVRVQGERQTHIKIITPEGKVHREEALSNRWLMPLKTRAWFVVEN